MKLPAIIAFLFMLSQQSKSQQTDSRCRIAPWLNNKRAAVSLTFDDGIKGQFTDAVPLLNQHGFKGSFFITVLIVKKQSIEWKTIKAASDSGHEIANHSLTHPHFATCGLDSIKVEIEESNRIIQQHIPQLKYLTHAYPFGEGGGTSATDKEIRLIASRYFVGARATQNKTIGYNPYDFAETDDDYYNVNSRMIIDSASISGFEADLDSVLAAGGWYVATYHGIENGWLIVKKKDFARNLEWLEARKQDLWIGTFSDILKYHKERRHSQIEMIHDGKKKIKIRLVNDLGNKIEWNQPLTILVDCRDFRIDHIMRGKKRISFREENSIVRFNALPGLYEIFKKQVPNSFKKKNK